MPPATKRKKEKEADFKKAKLKLGKGKKVPTNATNTSFKARSIALPGQQPLERAAIQQDPSSNFASTSAGAEPLTSSGLDLDEVLIRLRHPNAGVRRDSLGGVKEILKIRSGVEVGRVMRALGGMVADDDASVRKGLLGLLDWYFSITPEVSLVPHLPLFLLLTSSALSHIFPEIRLDAARLVSLLLQHVPRHITAGWPASAPSASGEAGATSTSGSTILEGLRLALGLGGDKASSAQGRLTAGGKLVFLKAVLAFVTQALEGGSDSAATESMWEGWLDEGNSASNKGAVLEVSEHGLAFDGTNEGWVVESGSWAVNTAATSGWELGRLDAGGSTAESGENGSGTMNLFVQLHPLLLSTFLESAPSAFSPTSTSAPTAASTETHIELCVVTATLTSVLAKHIITAAAPASEKDTGIVRARISDFLKRLSPYFPFSGASLTTGSSALSAGMELNLAYARLAALLAPQPAPLVYGQNATERRKDTAWKARVRSVEASWATVRAETDRRKGKGKGRAVDGWAMAEVAAWLTDILTPSQDMLSPPITTSTFSALLPIMWTLITQPPPPSSTEEDEENIPEMVGTALLAFIARQNASSALRGLGDDFVIRLVRTHEQSYPTLPFFIHMSSKLRAAVRGWIDGVPKALWEIGARDERATERLLRWLLDMGMRGAGGGAEEGYSLLDVKTYPSISARLAPFFHLAHPTRGSTMGPWTKLPEGRVRRLGLDVAAVWGEWDTEGRLGEAVKLAQAGIQ